MSDQPMCARLYVPKDADEWDHFVGESWNGTFLHKRRFLGYHGDRFQDMSLILENNRGKMIGVFPAASSLDQTSCVVSHPGITYGGIVHCGGLIGSRMIECFRVMAEIYKPLGINKIKYKTIPQIYHRVPSSDDIYALFRLNSVRYRCDLGATIDIEHRVALNSNRIRNLKKAEKSGIQIKRGHQHLDAFWKILEINLSNRHDTRPVHTVTEMALLCSLFPEQIECVVGLYNDVVIGGTILFIMPNIIHAQYISANDLGFQTCVLDMVFDHCIDYAKSNDVRYFDFGIDTEQNGHFLNESLHQFKCQFGAGGTVHEFYELQLD